MNSHYFPSPTSHNHCLFLFVCVFLYHWACLGDCFVPRPHFVFCVCVRACVRGVCLCAYLWENWKLSRVISAVLFQIGLLKLLTSSTAALPKKGRLMFLIMQTFFFLMFCFSPQNHFRKQYALDNYDPANGDNEDMKGGGCCGSFSLSPP